MRVPILTASRRLVSAGGAHLLRTNGVGGSHHGWEHLAGAAQLPGLDPANNFLARRV